MGDIKYMKSEEKYTLDESHLIFAKQTNSETWKLLEKDILSRDERDLLLYTAFASSYHWASAGEIINKQRGEWLISRAYSKLKMSESSLFHALKCYQITQNGQADFQDFDYAYANEALARSYALNGETEKAQSYYDRAVETGNEITNAKDREIFMDDLKAGNWNDFVPG